MFRPARSSSPRAPAAFNPLTETVRTTTEIQGTLHGSEDAPSEFRDRLLRNFPKGLMMRVRGTG